MSSLITFIEIAAIFAAAISGGLEARAKKMDFVGLYFVALATALGGGTMRDTLLGRFPVFWVTDNSYALYVLLFALLVVALYKKSVLESRRVAMLITFFDAVGLGLFSMVGSSIALEFHSAFFPAVLIGVVNGIVGGVLRDVLCNQIPAVFRTNTYLYATCSFLGCLAYLGLFRAGVPQPTAFVAGLALTFVIRVVAIRFKIGLPI
jgi:uncharacterized membrane protein YeiH